MCLGLVGQVIAFREDHPDLADVEVAGLTRPINVGLLDRENLQPGDWILIQSGFAMEKIDEATARMQINAVAEYTGMTPPLAEDDHEQEWP